MVFDSAGSTIMSVLLGIAQSDESERKQYLERFASQYTQPLVEYLCRAKQLGPEEAADLVQNFWLAKLILPKPADNLVAKYLDAQRTKHDDAQNSFRSYLMRSIANHCLDDARISKRKPLSLQDVPGFDIPEKLDNYTFDTAWANAILRKIVNDVRDECRANEQEEMWTLFCRQIVLPKLTGTSPPGYAQLAQEFDYSSTRSATNAVRTVIRKFQRILKQHIRNYLPIIELERSDSLIETEVSNTRSSRR